MYKTNEKTTDRDFENNTVFNAATIEIVMFHANDIITNSNDGEWDTKSWRKRR